MIGAAKSSSSAKFNARRRSFCCRYTWKFGAKFRSAMSLPLAVVSGDPIALCDSISKIAFESKPARSLSACISPSAPMTLPIMIWSMSFARAACVGVSPTNQRFAPMISMCAALASYASLEPPPMNKSSPLAASRHPPLTGAAKKDTRSPKISLVASPHSPSTVEQSTYVFFRVPLARDAPSAYALATAFAALGSLSMANVTSTSPLAISSTLDASVIVPIAFPLARSSLSNASRHARALSALRFHATTSQPPRASARAMALPMIPSPRKPTRVVEGVVMDEVDAKPTRPSEL